MVMDVIKIKFRVVYLILNSRLGSPADLLQIWSLDLPLLPDARIIMYSSAQLEMPSEMQTLPQ